MVNKQGARSNPFDVQGPDNVRHIPGDRGHKRDEPVGCDPEGVDEVQDLEDAGDDVHQGVGDVCREVAGELRVKRIPSMVSNPRPNSVHDLDECLPSSRPTSTSSI